MSKVNPYNYVSIQGWMVSDLQLKGNELIIYAIIYGFSQDGEQRFRGGLQYLADWTNSTKQGVQKALKSLISKGLIVKEDYLVNDVKFCNYYIPINECKEVDGMQQSFIPIQQSCTNNINNNINNNISNIVLSKDNTNNGGAEEFVFGGDVSATKTTKKSNNSEYDDAIFLVGTYTDNKELKKELTTLVNMKKEMASKQRYRFYASTIRNYLDELTKEFGDDDKTKIEAVKLSIRYNGTTKVMRPNTSTSYNKNIHDIEGFVTPDIENDGLNHTKSTREF